MRGLTNARIAGIAVLLFFSTMLGIGIHHLIQTGTCSTTGYNQYGPTNFCPKGTGTWVAFLVLGIFGSMGGLAGGVALLFAAVFGAVGLGSLTVALEPHASGKAFAIIFGGCFLAVALGSVAVVIGSIREALHPSAPQITTPPIVSANVPPTPRAREGDS